jgi:hypothetical protein
MCKYSWILGQSTLSFMIKSISFQSVIPETVQDDKRFYASWRSAKFCPNRNKRPRLAQWAYFWSHAWSVNQRVNISQRLLIDVPNHLLYFLYAQRCVQKVKDSWLTSLIIIILFTRATPRTKSKGLLIDVIYHPYTFYTHSASYKK